MRKLILHHFDSSPFAEKARLAMGVKSLEWCSVEIPMIMPKPLLMPLTGGYRKTPVLQIGADIYCDTSLILRVLDRATGERALFPAGSAGLGLALSRWSDQTFFEPGAALSMALNPHVPDEVIKDRSAFFNFMDFSKLQTLSAHMLGQFLAQMELLEWQFDDGRAFMTGAQPNAIDIFGYFPLWMARANVPAIDEHLRPFTKTLRWSERMEQIGHGHKREISAEQALKVALNSSPQPALEVMSNPEALKSGDQVCVVPTDYGAVDVAGELLGLNHRQITLRRAHPQVGLVNTHFPRSGYQIHKLD